ncbi:MAG: hypothetical protein ABIK90_07750 [candidate division WOR-3 bacterium]
MKEREQRLTPEEKDALRFIEEGIEGSHSLIIDKNYLMETFGLTHCSGERVCAVLGLVFHYSSRVSGGRGINPGLKSRYTGRLIANPAGSRQIWEEEHGKRHFRKGRFPTGRNTSGKRRAIRK